MWSRGVGVAPHRREWVGAARLARQVAEHDAKRISVVERRGIVPAFTEGVRHVADRGPPDLELNVVPGRSMAVLGVDVDCLRVALVPGVVVSAVTEVDPTDEGDVVVGCWSTTDHHKLLVMASTAPDALVEEELATRVVDLSYELDVLLLAEVRLPRVRPPQETTYVDAAPREVGEHVTHSGIRTSQTLIRVSLPIGEVHPVVPAEGAENLVEAGEVLGAVDQHFDAVALRPGSAVSSPSVELGGAVPALFRSQEPVVQAHDRSHYDFVVTRRAVTR